ncbi:Sel1 repeat-containing protein [Ferrimonas sediminum]|uniref:Sel1 repeat-containing protein n=1 Tax=Ferrimonas sediminum TaxID=718193 RepID=A0A1G8XGU2_9GAMM|nr:tetratricopeptide repeat protein [Ferrimonas sediminum]SDJ89782.1 Sel1 repeat-containing protein [Ferrimonas sediminum]
MAINDLELARRLDAGLVDDYRLARSYCLDVPTFALIHLRSVAHKLVDLLASAVDIKFKSKNLYDRIEVLNRAKAIDVRLARQIHKLRSEGNKGAHPEKYRLSQEQLVTLAQKAVEIAANLMDGCFATIKGQQPPEWQFEALDQVAGRELCYRAVMEGDHQAQYLVGISLKAKGLMQRERELSFAIANDSADINLDASASLLKQASYWFAQACDHHDGARFEHGVALIHGHGDRQDQEAGEELVKQAADAGLAPAQALLGYFYLSSSTAFEQNLVLAERYLLLAAEQDQAEAMANLGVLYHQGVDGVADTGKAELYTAQAARTGYPVAQYHLALMLLDKDKAETEQAMQWLQQAAEQRYPDAMADLARVLLDGEHLPQDPVRASHLYREAIRYAGLPRAMFELSLAIFDNEVPDADLVEGATLLQAAYHYAESGSDLHQAIEALSPQLVAAIEAECRQAASDQTPLLSLVLQRFDQQRLPKPFRR